MFFISDDVDPEGIERNVNFCRIALFSKEFFCGGSSSPLLDVKIRRQSRICLASPAERPIHLAHANPRLFIAACPGSLPPMITDR
jgi:hypothetical protein